MATTTTTTTSRRQARVANEANAQLRTLAVRHLSLLCQIHFVVSLRVSFIILSTVFNDRSRSDERVCPSRLSARNGIATVCGLVRPRLAFSFVCIRS